MSNQPENNWKVEFMAAAGTIFTAEGHKAPDNKELVTEDTFIHLGLVAMEKQDSFTQGFGADVMPLSSMWDRAVVNAEDFGIEGLEVSKSELDQDLFDSAYNDAYREIHAERRSTPDIAGDIFDMD